MRGVPFLLTAFLVLLLGALPAAAQQTPAFTLVPASPASAPAAPDASKDANAKAADKATDQDTQLLIKTLENPKDRDDFIRKLKALRTMRQQQSPPPTSGVQALDALNGIMEDAAQNFSGLMKGVGEFPQIASWIKQQWNNVNAREQWINIFLRALLSLVSGLAAFFLVRWALRHPRHALAATPAVSFMAKALVFFGYHLLRLLPIIAFTLASFVTLSALGLPGDAGKAVVAFLNAFIMTQLAAWMIAMLFGAQVPKLRFLPLSDESAAYVSVWSTRLVAIIIFGFFLTRAGQYLDVPETFLRVVAAFAGLLITLMAIIIVLQNRQNVAEWIRGKKREDEKRHFLEKTREQLADIWHILAIVYFILGYVVATLDMEHGFATLLRATVVTVAAFALFHLIMSGIDRLVARGFAVSEDLKREYPHLEERTNSYLPVFQRVVKALVWVLGAIIIVSAWGFDILTWFSTPLGARVLSSSISIGITLLVVVILWEIVSNVVDHYLESRDAKGRRTERSARMRTLLPLLRICLHIILVVVGGLIVLSQFGVDITPLLAGAGIIGLAIGFGSQTLVKDFTTGLFILIEDTISVGDIVKVKDHSGVVEAITMRTLRLRDVEGHVHSIPFSEVTSLVNMTKYFANVVIDLKVSYYADLSKVMQLMVDTGKALRQDPQFRAAIYDDVEMWGVDKYEDTGIVVRARIKVNAYQQWNVRRAYLLRLKKNLDEANIVIPQPVLGNVRPPEALKEYQKLAQRLEAQTTQLPDEDGGGTKA